MKVVAAVSEMLSGMRQLMFLADDDLLNYSALARVLKPAVEKKLGKRVNPGAVRIACKRFFKKFPKGAGEPLKRLHQSCKLSLKTDLAEVHVLYSHEGVLKLLECMHRISWAEGEKLLLLVRASSIMIVVASRHLNEVLSCFRSEEVLSVSKQRALVTLHYDAVLFANTFGGLALWANNLAGLGIKIQQIFSSWGQTSILIPEEDAPAALSKLSSFLSEAAGLSTV